LSKLTRQHLHWKTDADGATMVEMSDSQHFKMFVEIVRVMVDLRHACAGREQVKAALKRAHDGLGIANSEIVRIHGDEAEWRVSTRGWTLSGGDGHGEMGSALDFTQTLEDPTAPPTGISRKEAGDCEWRGCVGFFWRTPTSVRGGSPTVL
jgi:hypothetical protein